MRGNKQHNVFLGSFNNRQTSSARLTLANGSPEADIELAGTEAGASSIPEGQDYSEVAAAEVLDTRAESSAAAATEDIHPFDRQDINGNTALHLACMMGAIDVIKQLFNMGASTEITNIDGHTPLMAGIVAGHPESANTLLELIKHQDEIASAKISAQVSLMQRLMSHVKEEEDHEPQAKRARTSPPPGMYI